MFLGQLTVLFCVAFVVDASVIQECIRLNGVEYRGEQQVTATGRRCLNWASAPRDYNVSARLDADTGIGNHSFCRNPDSSGKPWCYVIYQDGVVQRQDCVIDTCRDETVGKITATTPSGDILTSPLGEGRVLDVSESKALQPPVGPSWPGRIGLKRKKDLGILGYVLGMVMITLIVLLGLGITLGYFYKSTKRSFEVDDSETIKNWAWNLRRQQQQRAYEQEMRRVALPLSAFSNPACELLDEMAPAHNAGPPQTPGEEPGVAGGAEPLIAQAGTPGA